MTSTSSSQQRILSPRLQGSSSSSIARIAARSPLNRTSGSGHTIHSPHQRQSTTTGGVYTSPQRRLVHNKVTTAAQQYQPPVEYNTKTQTSTRQASYDNKNSINSQQQYNQVSERIYNNLTQPQRVVRHQNYHSTNGGGGNIYTTTVSSNNNNDGNRNYSNSAHSNHSSSHINNDDNRSQQQRNGSIVVVNNGGSRIIHAAQGARPGSSSVGSNHGSQIRYKSPSTINYSSSNIRQPTYSQYNNRQQPKDNIPVQMLREQLQMSNGDRYMGQIDPKTNKIHGKGTYVFGGGKNLKYKGDFYNGYMHGWGVLTKVLKYSNSDKQIPVYQGEFQWGKKHGSGKYYYSDDNDSKFYNGNWEADHRHGKGLYQDQNYLYNGEWANGSMHGQGSYKFLNGGATGVQYKGNFHQGQFINGLVKYSNGDQYSGGLSSNGLRQGQGTYYSDNSKQRYRGMFRNNQRNGKGTVHLQNGDQLQGNFINGKIDWTQSCTYKWNSGEMKGTVFNGWFKDGIPDKGHVVQTNGQSYDTY